MLEELLSEISTHGTLQTPALAARLNTSVEMVEAMIATLERMGRLRPMTAACEGACGGCPLAGGCKAAGGRGRLWTASPLRQSAS